METVDITPSPRVLRMLGQIDFAPWQCLAELVDNSIDAFIDQTKSGSPSVEPKIVIKLPTEGELKEGTGQLVIKDTASGMSLEKLEASVRAGYSGNDPIEKMGLFGMGFNISTARMGRRTEVWTTEADDDSWTGVVIDFDELERTKTFQAPVITRPKEPFELEERTHGTEIRISRLEAERLRPLTRGGGKKRTRDRLGKIYGRVMNDLGVAIYYDGDVVEPWKHCAWDAKRAVETKAFGRVPARIEIDEELDPRQFCATCWVWLEDGESDCPSCGKSEGLVLRKRRVKGWIGIQRYFDKQHFGFDLIRNGRVIEELDKSFFTFKDDFGDSKPEYPIDTTHWGGRIIGELEIDFVRVSHQKDSFDKLDPEWKKVVEIVRGNSPLQPKIADRMGLEKNQSPLSRLFTGYRKGGTAGLKDLVPGKADGTGLNTGPVSEYVDRFYAGEKDFQSDEKWYELVLLAERGRRGESSGADDAAGDFPLDEDDDTSDQEDQPDAGNAPDDEEEGEPKEEQPVRDDELTQKYSLESLPGDIVLNVLAYRYENDIEGRPYIFEAEAGYTAKFSYNWRSPFFEESIYSPAEYLLIDLAQRLQSLAFTNMRTTPISQIADDLRKKYFPELLGDLSSIEVAATSHIEEIRRHFDEFLSEEAPIDVSKVPDEELKKVERRALKAESLTPSELIQLIEQGSFARFVSDEFVVEMARHWPQVLTDGQFYSKRFNVLPDDMKDVVLSEMLSALYDVCWLGSEASSSVSKDKEWRLRYSKAVASLKLLQYWRV